MHRTRLLLALAALVTAGVCAAPKKQPHRSGHFFDLPYDRAARKYI